MALEELTARLEPASTLAVVQRCWADVVGATIAAHATPVTEHDGVLQIACEEAVWAAELELLGPSLVAALNAAIGVEALSSVRLRADGSRRAARKRG
jgi:predicted nucleic acid-binding Zn ribbon protein